MSEAQEAFGRLGFSLGTPQVAAVFKQSAQDFRVNEDLGFELSGEGQHLCLHIRKTEVNTQHVVRQLARLANVRERDIGYAGLKDHMGVCEQWLSIYQAQAQEVDLSSLSEIGVEVLSTIRNSRKIRQGSHRSNAFRIILRDLRSLANTPLSTQEVKETLEARLTQIRAEGVPNYFGEQRFGHAHGNILMAQRLFSGELRLKKGFKRGMLLSAARSFVFNAVLSERVKQQNWNQHLAGDVMNLAGTGSVFEAPEWDETLAGRLAAKDIHPTGPLWGKGALRSSADAAALETAIAATHASLCEGLEAAGLEQARRSLRLIAADFDWTWLGDDSLELSFALPPGTYATAVLRELCVLKEAKTE
jgi:tRNA pseudouridine13 synthase